MYQPRRVSDLALVDEIDTPDAFSAGPRRAARSRIALLRGRLAPTVVSVALLATSGAFALNLASAEGSQQAVPAPVRAENDVTRDAARLAETTPNTEQTAEATSEATAEATADAAALVAGTWTQAFGAVSGELYAQSGLNVRAQPNSDAETLGSLESGDKVSVTDVEENDYRQISYDGKVGWVLADRLAETEPTPEPTASASSASASSSSSASASASSSSGSDTYTGSTSYSGKSVLGLRPSAMVVYNAVTAKWSFTAIGGYRASSLSNHQLGLAIDFMVYSDKAKGDAVADYLIANAATFNIDHIIWRQRIWTPYSPYWRAMADRGSITANHYDHVHVSMKS